MPFDAKDGLELTLTAGLAHFWHLVSLDLRYKAAEKQDVPALRVPWQFEPPWLSDRG